MSYILPRAIIVLIGWTLTCAVIHGLAANVGAMAFSIAAVSWALAGAICFGYSHRLRRDLREPHGRS